jgi:YD repeat-containing protein
VVDRRGYTHRYHYTGQNITQTDMWISSQAEYVTQFSYSGSVVVKVVLPRGNRIDFDYNGSDELLERRRKTTDTDTDSSADLVDTWAWTSHFVTSHTDSEANQATFTRNGAGDVTKVTFPTVTSPATQAADIDYEYNSAGQLTKITDEEEKVTQFSYFTSGASVGLLQKVEVDPTGLDLETTYTYSSAFDVATVTDPRGNATSYTWDTLRRLKQKTSASPLSIDEKWVWDANSNVASYEIENLDEDGDSVTANPWITTTWTYNVEDQVASIVEELDASTTRTTSFDYEDGLRLRVTKPEGNKEKWTYNDRGFVASHIDGETSLDAVTVEYAYDDNGNRTVFEDGRNNDWTSTFDLFDRRTKLTTPLGHYTVWDLVAAHEI